MNKEYKEALKDGRWQVRKTEIMQRDGFTCQECGAKATDGAVLNVHHIKYYQGRKPWEYEDKYLTTLCETCHLEYHRKKKEFEEALKSHWSADELQEIKGCLIHIESKVPIFDTTGYLTENHIYLLSRKVHDFIYDEVFPMLPCIDAEVMFCHANPLWDEWQFTTNANYDLKMVPRGTVQLEHEDEVEVFSGASAINLANKMIRGAECELEELIDYQERDRQNNLDYNEVMASLDRSEYEEIIKALKNFILEEQKKIIPQRKTEVQTSPQTVNSRKPLNYNIGFSWKPLKGK